MKVILALLAALAALLIIGCGGGGGQGVEGRLKSQINYFNGGDLRALYETCSSSWRAVNGFDSFKSNLQLGLAAAGLTGKTFEVTDIRVEERGMVASAAYTTKVDGTPVDVEEGERWVKEGDVWYQESFG